MVNELSGLSFGVGKNAQRSVFYTRNMKTKYIRLEAAQRDEIHTRDTETRYIWSQAAQWDEMHTLGLHYI